MITKAQLIPFSSSVFIWYENNDQRFCVPDDPANTDWQTFKKEVLAGAELQDADGNVMTPEQAKTYVATLP